VSAHSIRLHGPWSLLEIRGSVEATCRQATTETPVASMTRFRMDEAACALATSVDGSASLLLVRPFRQPTGLTETCRLRLKLQSANNIGEVWLNGQRLTVSTTENTTYAVDTPLAMQNRLGVVMSEVSVDAPLLNSVSLIIEDRA
jgi:hypothetical protein